MSSTGAAKVKKSPAKKKTPSAHPPYVDMIKAAITANASRSGVSRQKIVKYIKANYKVGDNFEGMIKVALRRAVTSGKIVQVKGAGASGSFKLAAKAASVSEKKPRKPKAVKSPAKKPAAKPKVKKSPAKKKPKSPAKKAAPKKKQSVKKTPTKKPTTPKRAAPKKKATPKKAAAKKPAKK